MSLIARVHEKSLIRSNNYPTWIELIPPISMSVLQIMNQLENRIIRIPDFQRAPVWTANQVELLLDSIFKGYPIGSFLLWKTTDKLRERNPLNLRPRRETIEKRYLLDGQQRAITLYGTFKNSLKIRSGRRRVDYRAYFDLSNKTFNLYKKSDLQSGRTSLSEHQVALDQAIIIDTQRQSIERSRDLVSRLARENMDHFNSLDELYQAFRAPIVSAIVVETGGLEAACEIFVRLNKEGTPLSIVDLMVAKTYSTNPYFNLRNELEELNNEFEPSFMLKNLTILECLAACLERGCSSKDILATSDRLSNSWSETTEALKEAIDYLQQRRKVVPVSKFLPFDILLAPLAYFFFSNERPSPNQLDQIEKFFWRASASQRYIEGQNAKIREDIQRMDGIAENDEAPTFPITLRASSIKSQQLRFGSSISKTILCLYSTLSPRDIRDDAIVPLSECFAAVNTRQIHHIFPRKYLNTLAGTTENGERMKKFSNSMANVCLVTALSNQIVGSRPPSEYLAALSNTNMESTLESHLIDGGSYETLMDDDFEAFLEARAHNIFQALREKYS